MLFELEIKFGLLLLTGGPAEFPVGVTKGSQHLPIVLEGYLESSINNPRATGIFGLGVVIGFLVRCIINGKILAGVGGLRIIRGSFVGLVVDAVHK